MHRPSKVAPLLKTSLGLATLAALGLAAARPASAQDFTFSYSGTGVSASGTLTAAPVAGHPGEYLVTGITGTRNGDSITGLIPVNGYASNDNLIEGSGPSYGVDYYGISYNVGSTQVGFGNLGFYYAEVTNPPNASGQPSQGGVTRISLTISPAAVPGPPRRPPSGWAPWASSA